MSLSKVTSHLNYGMQIIAIINNKYKKLDTGVMKKIFLVLAFLLTTRPQILLPDIAATPTCR